MSFYAESSDEEITAKLAERVGCDYDLGALWRGASMISKDWDPCNNRDDLAVVVEHIQKDNDLAWALDQVLAEIHKPDEYLYATLLTCPPRIIAEACLEVLEGRNARD